MSESLRDRLLQEADEITCYASTPREYRPNATAKLLREAADALQSETRESCPKCGATPDVACTLSISSQCPRSSDKEQRMTRTFEYLLNAMEGAARSDSPFERGYGDKRRAVFQHVEDLWNDYMRLLREKQDKLDQSATTPLSNVGTFTMVGLDTIKFEREDDADVVMNAILDAKRTTDILVQDK